MSINNMQIPNYVYEHTPTEAGKGEHFSTLIKI